MASSKQLNKVSKFLSFVLRHKPEAIGLELDTNGWANIDDLISKANASSEPINLDRTLIQEVVDTSDKKRFIISDDGQNIRANQGHSINVDLQLKPVTPPEFLYHGTATRFLNSILQEGLKPQQRQYVHLSTDIETATAVGQRYGKPLILKIKALLMHEQGFVFYQSENGVWLTESVPSTYLISQS
ncbi:RNA 2'-phosphotransferase [Marinobacter fuscus]|uniref:Probable RNA 2'-phosphotransferase n=1 Tax=Marinobacter fuscus TaxID=2109942 RepID=A0A2T1K7A0_9GAMM|nr:RNA 2'-phosphotransferase [Marinobacter fuscus]PSF05918.1 RNA 2'-phosphotransferase [Marinobacter fuscus]